MEMCTLVMPRFPSYDLKIGNLGMLKISAVSIKQEN